MENPTIISEKNANRWAEVFALVNKINTLKTVDDFYGTVEPPCYGLKEVYDHLLKLVKKYFEKLLSKKSSQLQKTIFPANLS